MMDISIKLKALSRLSESKTEEADNALKQEFIKTQKKLASTSSYEVLDNQLDIHDALAPKNPDGIYESLTTFILSLEDKNVTHSGDINFQEQMTKYQNSYTLISKALNILGRLRYTNTEALFLFLLELTNHNSQEIRNSALQVLKETASYKINIIYGNEKINALGFNPQLKILKILKSFDPTQLKHYFIPILEVANELLSAVMDGRSWESYDTLSISKGLLPADETIASIRSDTLLLLKSIYPDLESIKDRLRLINTINGVTSLHGFGRPENFLPILNRDCLWVLDFYIEIVTGEKLQVIQRIEHNGYWIYYHTPSDAVSKKALELETAISQIAEYQIYKTLIGFEGIQIPWATYKVDNDKFDVSEQVRTKNVQELAKNFTKETYDKWLTRIIEYSNIESNDLATFPKFYEFINLISISEPKLILDLVLNNHQQIKPILIPLLRGLSVSNEKNNFITMISYWIQEDKYLDAISRAFIEQPKVEIGLIKQLVNKSIAFTDVNAISSCISIAVTNYNNTDNPNQQYLNEIFIPALNALSTIKSANWIYDFWFRKDATKFISSLPAETIDLILINLSYLHEINYHGEEVLYQISLQYPEKVLAYFSLRLKNESIEKQSNDRYEAIPYEFYKLNESLSKIPSKCLEVVFLNYQQDSYLFQFRGAVLIKNIFKTITEETEKSIFKFLKPFSDDRVQFIIWILRNYEGQPFTYPVVKHIIQNTPVRSEFWNELAVALESTGVVMGEFGFVEAYERKVEEVKPWLNEDDAKIVQFAEWYIEGITRNIDSERARAEEQLALRKHNFE